jgi:hypothetical protein
MTVSDVEPSGPPDLRAASAERPSGYVFRREGEYWTIAYEGALFRLRDGKGLRYLAHLLSHPDQPIACGDVWSAAGDRTSEVSSSAERLPLRPARPDRLEILMRR